MWAGQGQQAHEVLAVPCQASWDHGILGLLTQQGWPSGGWRDSCAGGRNRSCQQ